MTKKGAAARVRQQLLGHARGADGWGPVRAPIAIPHEDKAVPKIRSSIESCPVPEGRREDTAILYRQSLAAWQSGDIHLALTLISQACADEDVPAEYLRIKAELLRRRGNLDEANSVARLALRLNQNCARAWETLGHILAEQNELTASRDCYEAAIRLDPDFLEAIANLAIILQRLGQFEAAEVYYHEVLRRAPDHVEARLNFVCLLGALGRYQEALAAVETVIAHHEEMLNAYLLASMLECNMGRYRAALVRIERAMVFAPDQSKLLTRRAEILSKLGNDEAALADCDRVLHGFPTDAEALHVKALILRSLNRPEEALAAFRSAELASADLESSMATDRAWLLAEMGRKSEALVVLDQVLSSRRDSPKALHCRAFLTRYEPGDPDLAAMERLIGNANTPYCDRMRLSFSLGKAYLEMGDGAKAFSYLNSGNKLKRNTINYDPCADGKRAAAMATLFSAKNLSSFAGGGAQSARPIFVFGMPRSGTTLVEQILASHPLVRGTGESPHLDTLARTSIFLPSLAGFTPENLASCGQKYLTIAGAAAPASRHFVDKTTTNFLYVGLISLILPGARMIHCRRDPLDTCLSCYSLLFTDGHEFSYELGELGHYHRLYRELMAHWSDVLPQGSVLDVDYEALVNDAEGQVRKVLEFCALPWDDSCLRFYETKRLVTTSSLDQVRLPLYKTSIGRAQMFRPWLGELEGALERQLPFPSA